VDFHKSLGERQETIPSRLVLTPYFQQNHQDYRNNFRDMANNNDAY
jgi:hypothetical protein